MEDATPARTAFADLPHDLLMHILWHLRFDFYPRKRILSVLCKSGRHEGEWREFSRFAKWSLDLVKPCRTPWDHSLRRTAWLKGYMALAGAWQCQGSPDALEYRSFHLLIQMWNNGMHISYR